MKTFIVLVVFSTFCGIQAANRRNVPSLLPSEAYPHTPANDDSNKMICDGGYGPKCKDCFNMLICLGPDEPSMAGCPSETPYCDPDKLQCTSQLPQNSSGCDGVSPTSTPSPTPQFICTSEEGFYPHPTDCTQYFECHNTEAINYRCPPGYSWSTNGMGCRQRKSGNDCGHIICNQGNSMAALSNNKTFYGYCGVQEAIGGVVVNRCLGSGYVFDSAGNICVFECTSEGLFQDSLDPTHYFECYKFGYQIVYTYNQCSSNRTFSNEEQRCLDVEEPAK